MWELALTVPAPAPSATSFPAVLIRLLPVHSHSDMTGKGNDLVIFPFFFEEQQRSVHAVHVKSAAPLLGGPGGRSKGQTSQHPAHLSALNYKICTGEHSLG